MSFFRRFPYSNAHDLNLDWIIDKINNIKEVSAAALAEILATGIDGDTMLWTTMDDTVVIRDAQDNELYRIIVDSNGITIDSNGTTLLRYDPSIPGLGTDQIACNQFQADTASFTNPLAVTSGGTGAATAAGARTNLGAVNIAGDTMTGNLQFKSGGYPTIGMLRSDNTRGIWMQPNISGDARFQLYQYNTAGTFYERYDLPALTAGLSSNVGYDILTSKQTVVTPSPGGHAVTSAGGYIRMGKVIVLDMTVVIDTSISQYSIVADDLPLSVSNPVFPGVDSSYTTKVFKLDSGKIYCVGGCAAGTYYINGSYIAQ